jgi:hypothetical protein
MVTPSMTLIVIRSDRIQLSFNSATNGDFLQGLIFFQKSDFIGSPSGAISFDGTSSASMTNGGQAGSAGPGGGTRFAVLDGSTWYLSNTDFNGFAGTTTIADLSTENFAAYDPTGAPLNSTPGSFTTAGSTFTDIQAVGYYFGLGSVSASSTGMPISAFEISGVVVPEPSTAVLFLGGLAGLALIRRRK